MICYHNIHDCYTNIFVNGIQVHYKYHHWWMKLWILMRFLNHTTQTVQFFQVWLLKLGKRRIIFFCKWSSNRIIKIIFTSCAKVLDPFWLSFFSDPARIMYKRIKKNCPVKRNVRTSRRELFLVPSHFVSTFFCSHSTFFKSFFYFRTNTFFSFEKMDCEEHKMRKWKYF